MLSGRGERPISTLKSPRITEQFLVTSSIFIASKNISLKEVTGCFGGR
jgi:hypothetical protein